MRFPAYLLPLLEPSHSNRCISGVNIDGTHSIVAIHPPLFLPSPSWRFARSSQPLPLPPSSRPAPPLSLPSSCDGKFESEN